MGIKGSKRKKTVLILGIDGYIGWPLAKKLQKEGHKVLGIDDFSRRLYTESLVPISTASHRKKEFNIRNEEIG